MSFCGSREGSLSVKEGVLRNKCFIDVMNIIPHGLFIIVTITILIAWRQSIMGKLKAKTWVHFRCHSIRWILTLILILVNCLEIAEGFVSDYIDPDSTNYHVIIPPCVFLVSSILSIILYHNIEMWNSPRFLLIMIPYWLSSCGLKLLKVFSLNVSGIGSEHLRLWISWVVVVLYLGLIIVEAAVLLLQRYAFFKKQVKVHPPSELTNTRYYATFANFLSRATFWWMNPVLIQGYKMPLTNEKLGKLPHSEKAMTNYKLLLDAFETERENAARKNQQPSMHRTYLRSFWPLLLLAGVFRLLGDLLAFVGPMCIENIVDFAYAHLETTKNTANTSSQDAVTYSPISPVNISINITGSGNTIPDLQGSGLYVTVTRFCSNGYGLCVLLFVTTVIQHTLLQNHHFLVIRQGVRLRSAIQTMVFTKALRLSSLNLTNNKTTIGQIMNHMTMDSSFLMMLFFFIHYLWATPVQVVLALVMMYSKLGVSALAGGLLIVLTAPAQVFIGRGMSNMQKKIMQQADKRVKRCNEMVQGIKVIKLLAWETYIGRNINEARARELKFLFLNAIFRALFTFTGTAVPALATLITFVLYPHIEDQPLTAGKALSCLALFNILAVPLVLFTLFTSSLIMANVSCKRLIPYFLLPEVEGLHNASDTIQTNTESIIGETDVDIHMGGLSLREKHDNFGGSACSLVSHHSHSPHHTRQNSSPSLVEFSTEPLLSGVPRRHSAVALSVGGDHHPRQRFNSGRSDDDYDAKDAVEITDGEFSWDLEKKTSALKNIQIHVPSGKLIIVVGPVGSGKTSLLSAMLGEMITVSGKVHWCRGTSIAYVSQKPWLLNKTLRDNILFGRSFMWKRYQKVIEACALQPDIDTLPAGDLTEIGEKGINLSGGQKQRISIARALYSSADTFLLDDPLSALDAHVGHHVFDNVVMKKLLHRKKTVVLVTHQLQYLNYAHSVLVMKEGELEYQGKLSEVKKTHPELYESWRKALKEAKSAETLSRKNSVGVLDGTIDHLPASCSRQTSLTQQTSVEERKHSKETNGRMSAPPSNSVLEKQEETGEEPEEDADNEGSPSKDKAAAGTLIQKEHREVGSVRLRVYFRHLRACGFPLVVLVLLLLIANQGLLVSTNVWISHWASQSTFFLKNRAPNSTEEFDNYSYIPVYVTFSVCAVVFTLLSGFAIHFTGIRGSKTLHSDMLDTVTNCPMRFFDTTPSGRVINRFSSDMAQIDQRLPGTWDAFLRCALSTFAAIIVNCVGTPFFLFAVVPLLVLYWCMQRFYTATARELQRLDSVTKSPIFSHFSETLNGLQTIRAYRAQSRFRHLAVHAIDTNVVPFLFTQTANRWLGIRLDYMGAILVFTASVASLSAGLSGSTDPAFIGLCIAYALMVSNYLNWIVRNSTELEMIMNAVERVDEYIKLDTEVSSTEAGSTEPGWPMKGEIEFENISLCYDKKLEPVVTGISFKVNAGEKIGICGRTGSGKSSLTLSLFRMIDITEGQIRIDGKNICHVPLQELRAKLAIIPQDPTLFTGTIRYNLDPGEEMTDDKIWNALDHVQLKSTIEALPDKLESSVSEGGENFSIGQKQLFCLARAFLRENKIVVLDEATASIDLETDNKLQYVISTVFSDKTVITIAHRVSTIMKYDRVMAMEGGKILEFDSPLTLMENEDSHFAQLVKQSYSS